jgi:rubrerythrin
VDRRGPRIVVADGPAETAEVAAFERDRRELLRRGLGLGGTAVAASAIPLLLTVRNAFAASDTDGALLDEAITLERVAVLAYDTIVEGGVLKGALARQVRILRDHEQQHAAVLTKALTDLGGTPPPAPSGLGDVDKVIKGLGGVRTPADALSFAIELETATVAAYHDAEAKFVEAKLLQTTASIMGCEGQHLVVLRQAAGRPPVPHALESGGR